MRLIHSALTLPVLFGLPGIITPAPAFADDTTRSGSANGFVGAPFAKYSPETGFAGGAVGLYYFRIGPDTGALARPSSVSGGVTYTQKKQVSTGVDYDFYFAEGTYHWSGDSIIRRSRSISTG